MSSVRRVLLTIAVGAAVGAGPAVAAPAMANHNDNNRSARLAALMTDRGVVAPQAADPDGWGAVNVRVRSNGRVCYTYFIRRVANPKDLTIYLGGRGNQNDPDDARLNLGDGGIGQGCQKIDKVVARAMIRWPYLYNVQVVGGDGAIRGQLFRNGNR